MINKFELARKAKEYEFHCTIRHDSNQNLVLTFLDSGDPVETNIVEMYKRLAGEGKNKVLWWGNRGLILEFKNQYDACKTKE